MFEGEDLKDGVTLKVYRFDSQTDPTKRLLSILVRMQGPACEKGQAILGPLIARRKLEAQKALEAFEKAHERLVRPKWYQKALERFRPPTDDLKALTKEYNVLKGRASNVLFDFPELEGETTLKDLTVQFEAQGLTVKSDTRRSNAELDEQVLLFA